MFIPLYDGVPMRRIKRPSTNYGIIGLTIAIHTVLALGPGAGQAVDYAALSFGMIPSVLFGNAILPPSAVFIPEPVTLFTSLFLHGGWLHLFGNMLFLWVFGDNVEDAMGHVRYFFFYILCGLCAGLAHAVMQPLSDRPLVGASGAISGVVAAYVMLYPRVHLWALFFNGIPLHLKATWAIGLWIGIQILSALWSGDEAIGWWAHIGGLAAGFTLVRLFLAPGVKLFAPEVAAQTISDTVAAKKAADA